MGLRQSNLDPLSNRYNSQLGEQALNPNDSMRSGLFHRLATVRGFRG
jgi:hypothetical protein